MKALLLLFFSVLANQAFAQTLATRGPLKATVEDFYTHNFMSAPAKIDALRASAREIDNTITDILAPRAYALKGAAMRADYSPDEQRYFAMQLERAPLSAALNIAERRARASFSAKESDGTARARELWLLDTKAYYIDEHVDITQVFFDPAMHPFDELVRRIEAAQAELRNGAKFDDVVLKYSDDKQAKENKGRLTGINFAGADARMGALLFKQLKEGEVSTPTVTRAGLHLIRLNKKHPRAKRSFEEVRMTIVSDLLEQAAKEARLSLLDSITEGTLTINEEGLKTLMPVVDPKLGEKMRDISRLQNQAQSEKGQGTKN